MNNSFSLKTKLEYIQIRIEGMESRYFEKRAFAPYLKELLGGNTNTERVIEIEKKVAWHCALKVIAKRGISSFLLEKRMINLGISKEIAGLAINACIEKGLLNDEKRIEALINYYFAQGKGPRNIQQKLRIEFNLSEQEIYAYFERHLPEEIQEEKIKEIIIRKFKGGDKEKTLRFLLQRGFLLSTIKSVL